MEKILKLYKYVNGVNDTPFPNDTNHVIITSFRYDAKRMGGSPVITCTAISELCLDKLWDYNVYASFNGEMYFIKQIPTSSYDNSDSRYKHEIELVSERAILDNVYVYDVVDSESTQDKPVSNSSNFSFFGDISEFANRLNQSLTYSKVGYRIVVDEGITSDAKMVSFKDQFFSNAIQESYNTYDIPYYFVGKVIHFGYTSNAITHTFKYGSNESLLSIQKQNANYKVVNRVTGVGSADNIPYYYPNEYESKEEVEANGGTWVNPQTNLMPSIYRESLGKERFYEALNNTYKIPNSSEYYEFENPYIEGNPKEHIVNFEDIKPTIKGITNAEGIRIDMFSELAFDKNDNDEVDEEGNYLHPYFFAKLRKFDGEHGFNLFDQAIDEQEMVISMTSGSCGACEFVIGVDESTQKNIVQVDNNGDLVRDDNGNVKFGSAQDRQNDTSKYEVWIALRKDIDTFGIIMPNATHNYKPSINDTFVILHIDLPKAYILAAEDKLKEELIKYMSLNNSEKFNFSISFSRIFFAENPSIIEQLNENARIQIEYDNTTYEFYISSYSYSMSKDVPLPEIRIELSDTLTISQNALQTAISEVKSEIISTIGGSVNVDILKQGLRYFLRKDKDDTAKGVITFEKGWKTKDFLGGLLGKGAKVDEAGQAELHSLFVRTFMEVPEFRKNRVTVRMGDSITSCSAGIVKSINVLSDTSGTIELKLEDGEFGSLEVDDIVFQIFSDMENKENNSTETSDDGKGNRTIKGFATVMFKVTGVFGEHNEIIAYSLRPINEGGNGVHPFQFGTFSQRGNFDNSKPERQVVIYEGIYPQPYTRYMFGVNDWEFSAKMIGMQLGDLSNLSVFGMDMSGYSAYLNNVYFTGQIRQLYIPQWMDGESSAQNGTLVFMGGDHYVAKGNTDNPPLFDLMDEDGNSLLFTDEDGEGNLLDLNNDEYDMLAKKGDDGVGIKSNVSYYLISETSSKPSESSLEWSSSMVQPTDLKPYLWKKTVITYTNLVKNTTIECISVRGKDGTSVSIKGSYNSEAELKAAYPNGPDNASDAYIVGGDLYVWTGSEWKNVGAIKGEKGDTAYIHLKYANETSSGTQVNVGGSVVTLSFTSNDGEDMGDWMGIYTDYSPNDSKNIADYKWKNIKGSKGDDATSYQMDSPIGVINFTSDGYPNPTSFVVSVKKQTGNGNMVACSDFYLATWKYDGNWQLVSVSSVKTSSVTIIPAATTAYKQYRVTAHSTTSVSETNIIIEKGIGVSFDGMKGADGKDGKDGENGKDGEDGIFVYDCGLYDSTRAYFYKTMDGKVRRDKMVYEIGGAFYNFLVRSRQSDSSTGLINTPPTSAGGDANWEVMSQYQSLIANTIFGTNANIGGFMTSAEKMLSQSQTTDGEPLFELNGQNGTMTMRQSVGTSWKVDENGVQSVGNSEGERIEINPNTRSVSSFDKDGVERTVIDGSEYTLSELVSVEGGAVPLLPAAAPSSGYSVNGYGAATVVETIPISNVFHSTAGVLDVTIASMRVDIVCHLTRDFAPDEIQPYGAVRIYIETYDTQNQVTLISKKVVGTVSAYGKQGMVVTATDFRKVTSVPLTKGYHRLVANVEVSGASDKLGATVTGVWSVTSSMVSVKSYVSRHFANGMFLSYSSSEYFIAMEEKGKMIAQVASGGNVYSIRNGSFTVNGFKQPITVYAARVTDTSESPSVAPSKVELLNNGTSATLYKTSNNGEYTLTIPSSYGLTANNMLINLVGYGTAAGENSDIKATLRSYMITSTAMVLTIRTSDDATGNYGGFYIEIKKIV